MVECVEERYLELVLILEYNDLWFFKARENPFKRVKNDAMLSNFLSDQDPFNIQKN